MSQFPNLKECDGFVVDHTAAPVGPNLKACYGTIKMRRQVTALDFPVLENADKIVIFGGAANGAFPCLKMASNITIYGDLDPGAFPALERGGNILVTSEST